MDSRGALQQMVRFRSCRSLLTLLRCAWHLGSHRLVGLCSLISFIALSGSRRAWSGNREGDVTLVDSDHSQGIDAKNQATLMLLARMLAGEEALDAADQVFSDPFVIHMDGHRSESNPRNWRRWVSYMREGGRVSGLRGELVRLEAVADGTIRAHGRWHGTRRGESVSSGAVVGRYCFAGDRVCEMWTSRRNYSFIFGPSMGTLPGLCWVYIRYLLWSRGRGRG